METSVNNWSTIEPIRALLVSTVFQPPVAASVTSKFQTHLEALGSSWKEKKNVLNLILSLKMTNYFNLQQKSESEVKATREFLCKIEDLAHSSLEISAENRKTVENNFVIDMVKTSGAIPAGGRMLKNTDSLALNDHDEPDEQSHFSGVQKRNLTFGNMSQQYFTTKSSKASTTPTSLFRQVAVPEKMEVDDEPAPEENPENEFKSSNYKTLVRQLPESTIKNFHYFEKGTGLLEAAGVDLTVFARSLRKLDRTRMMARSLERAVNRQRSMGLQMILKVKIRRTRGLENANNRVKGRMMLAYSQLYQNNLGPQKYFYGWYLKANPDILKKLAWHLIIKQRMSTSVAVFRLSYLAKIQTARKKVNNLGLMEKLSWLANFIEHKRLLDKKAGFDRLNPMHHNGKYLLLERIWGRHMRLRRENLQKCMRVLTRASARIRRMLQILRGKNSLRVLDAFRNLRSFNRQERKEQEAVKDNLKRQKKDLVCLKYLMMWYRSQQRRALLSLRNHRRGADARASKNQKNVEFSVNLLNRNQKANMRDALERLRRWNRVEGRRLDKEAKLKHLFWNKTGSLGRRIVRDALDKLRGNARRGRIAEKYTRHMDVNYKGKLLEAIDKLRRATRVLANEDQGKRKIRKRLLNRLLGMGKSNLSKATEQLRKYAKKSKDQEMLENGRTAE